MHNRITQVGILWIFVLITGCGAMRNSRTDADVRPISPQQLGSILHPGGNDPAQFVGIDLASIDWSTIRMPLPVRSIYLEDCRISRQFAQWVAAQPSVTGISVKGSMDASVLLESTELQRKLDGISITDGRITEQMVRNIALFTKLFDLNLMETDLNDVQALYLAGHLHLAQFFIGGTRVTSAGVIEIIKLRPGMGIYVYQ